MRPFAVLIAALGCLLNNGSGVAAPIERLSPRQVAPQVYVVRGAAAEPGAANDGAVVNTAFIVGPRGVVVIDSGPHRRYGEALFAAIRRATRLPVRLLINTHPHPENVLGNVAFARRGVPILAAARTRELMQLRCPVCVKSFSARLGVGRMRGTEIVLADRTVSEPQIIEVAGLRLRLLPFAGAHSDSDLAVLEETTGVLFAGGLLNVGEIPSLREARVTGWLDALDALRSLPFSQVVPGHGPATGAAGIDALAEYLRTLMERARAALDSGVDRSIAAADGAALPQFGHWAMYGKRHALNYQHVLSELEQGTWDARD